MPQGPRGDFDVHWRTFGSGPEKALLLHCALASSSAWARLAPFLSDRLTMIAPDMPGHGRSGHWDQRCDLHDQVTAIARDCLSEGGHVIGHSFGATVALRLAVESPDLVHSLTLIEPVLFAAARQDDPDAFDAYAVRSHAFVSALASDDWLRAAREFIAVWGDQRPWDDLSAAEQEAFAARMPFVKETEACLVDDTAGVLRPGRLEAVRCPTCLIRGAETDPVIAAIHTTLARRIPTAKDHVLDGAGHMVPVTHPERVAPLIRSLIASEQARDPCNVVAGAPSSQGTRARS